MHSLTQTNTHTHVCISRMYFLYTLLNAVGVGLHVPSCSYWVGWWDGPRYISFTILIQWNRVVEITQSVKCSSHTHTLLDIRKPHTLYTLSRWLLWFHRRRNQRCCCGHFESWLFQLKLSMASSSVTVVCTRPASCHLAVSRLREASAGTGL